MIKIQTDKRGTILVFTLIILAVFLSTALTFSYFVISDINKAKAIDDSIIAYYGADSAVEESLYLLKKQEPVETLASLKSLTGRLEASGANWDIAESIDYERNILRQRMSSGQSAKFFILNRQTSATTTNSVAVEWYKIKNSATKLQVVLTQLSPQDQDESIIYYTDTSEVDFTDSEELGGSRCFNLKDARIDGTPLGNKPDYLLEVLVLGVDTDGVDRLMIRAYGDADCRPESYNERGISSLTLKAKGVFGKATQYIIAHIIPRDPVSGMLSFVLFSEQDITKDSE